MSATRKPATSAWVLSGFVLVFLRPLVSFILTRPSSYLSPTVCPLLAGCLCARRQSFWLVLGGAGSRADGWQLLVVGGWDVWRRAGGEQVQSPCTQ